VGEVINKYGMAKHFQIQITPDSFTYQRNRESINEEATLDGLYVVRTSVPEETLTAEDTVKAYKSLSKVEQAFRSYKTIDLKVRPIYHRNSDRVKAHVFLCMLAYLYKGRL
jgi:transposase